MKTYSNPNPNLHINMLKVQLAILQLIRLRKLKEHNFDEAEIIKKERALLFSIISKKEIRSRQKQKEYFNDIANGRD